MVSQRTGHIVFLLLCALVPLIIHTGVYSYALLPKRFILVLGLLAVAIAWAIDLRAKRTSLLHSPFYIPLFIYFALVIASITQAVNPVAA